jgi:hypothetical protein
MLPMRIIFATTIQYDSAFQQIALRGCLLGFTAATISGG